MQYASNGNSKIGKRAVVTSRAIGDSCPDTCHFLDNGCYAQHSEKQYPGVREAWLDNLIQPWNKIRSMLLFAIKNGKAVRLHGGGDFFLNGKLDLAYLANFKKAVKSILDDGLELPDIWVYTHVYDKRIVTLCKYGVNLYASVHGRADVRRARKLGFTKFALVDTANRIGPKRKGGSKDAPKYFKFDGMKFLVCPEQRLGRKRVTCTGGDGSTACLWCVKKSGGHVLFLQH